MNLMHLVDKQFLETPFYGVRQMTRNAANLSKIVGPLQLQHRVQIGQGLDTRKPNCIMVSSMPSTLACLAGGTNKQVKTFKMRLMNTRIPAERGQCLELIGTQYEALTTTMTTVETGLFTTRKTTTSLAES